MIEVDRGLRAAEIRELVGDSPVMLEIGCNGGGDTQCFLDAMPGIHLFCFEPDPRPLARFKPRLDDPRITLIRKGVSDKDGNACFHLSGGKSPQGSGQREWDCSSSLFRPTENMKRSFPWLRFTRQIEVDVVRLDTWLVQYPDIQRIDFVWADTQGAEEAMILGGRATLQRTRYLYTEFYNQPLYEGQPNLERIVELLPSFELIGIYARENALFRNREHLG